MDFMYSNQADLSRMYGDISVESMSKQRDNCISQCTGCNCRGAVNDSAYLFADEESFSTGDNKTLAQMYGTLNKSEKFEAKSCSSIVCMVACNCTCYEDRTLKSVDLFDVESNEDASFSVATFDDFSRIKGNVAEDGVVMAKCNCTACNSCNCACSCYKTPLDLSDVWAA